jgi:26S proteasome regulatory subunit N2
VRALTAPQSRPALLTPPHRRAAKAIDQYVELRGKPDADAPEPDARLVAIVERMFDRCVFKPALCLLHELTRSRRSCFADGQYQQAIGIALESRRLDKLEQAVLSSGDAPAHLAYALRVCQTLVSSRDFRRTVRHLACNASLRAVRACVAAARPSPPLPADAPRVASQVLRVLVTLYEQAAAGTDFVSVCQCLMFLDDAPAAAALLERLIDGSEARFLSNPNSACACGRLR